MSRISTLSRGNKILRLKHACMLRCTLWWRKRLYLSCLISNLIICCGLMLARRGRSGNSTRCKLLSRRIITQDNRLRRKSELLRERCVFKVLPVKMSDLSCMGINWMWGRTIQRSHSQVLSSNARMVLLECCFVTHLRCNSTCAWIIDVVLIWGRGSIGALRVIDYSERKFIFFQEWLVRTIKQCLRLL
jgi:hypothetical protein